MAEDIDRLAMFGKEIIEMRLHNAIRSLEDINSSICRRINLGKEVNPNINMAYLSNKIQAYRTARSFAKDWGLNTEKFDKEMREVTNLEYNTLHLKAIPLNQSDEARKLVRYGETR